MNRGFFNSSWAKSQTWYNLAKFSMADDSQAEKVTHWNGLSISAKVILARDTNDATYLMLALGKEENYLVREAAAWHESATPEVLMKALRDSDPDVRWAAAQNKNATAEVKTKYGLRYYFEMGRFPEGSLITPAAISALVRDQRVDLERLGDQIESSPFRNNEYIRASIQLEKKRREKQ